MSQTLMHRSVNFATKFFSKVGDIAVLMNNAGISAGGGTFENLDAL